MGWEGSHTIHEGVGHEDGDISVRIGGRVMDIHGSLCLDGAQNNDKL